MPKQIHHSPSAPPAAGPYSVATEAAGLVFVSGQVGIDPATKQVVEGGVAAECRQVMTNITAILGDLGLELDDIVKTTIFLADIADFGTVNEVYGGYVGDAKPARSTIQVGALPLGVQVEIDVVAAR